MITNAILILLYAAVVAITSPLRLLPSVTAESGFTQAVTTAANYLKGIDTVFPVSTMAQILGAILTIELGVVAYKLIMWGIKKIPTIS